MSALNANSVSLLKFIFGAAWEDAWICWTGDMRGTRVRDLPAVLPDTNIYFSVAMLKAGAKDRHLDQVESVRALVIDDVGTKIDKDAFKLMAPAPNWVVETSPGNYQCGYRLEAMSPVDFTAMRQGMKLNPIWGKSDGVDTVHLFRLPQGRNSKNGFLVKLNSVDNSKMDLSVFRGSGGAPTPAPSIGDEIESEALLQTLVDLIPNNGLDRQGWVDMAHAIWGASGGTAEAVFMAWSARWTQGTDDPGANALLWAGIRGSSIGRAWLLRAAGAAGDVWMRVEAAAVFDDGVDVRAAAATGTGQVSPHHRTVAWEIEKAHGHVMRYNHDNGCWHTFGATWAGQPASVKVGFTEAWTWVNRHILSMTAAEVKMTSKADFFSGVETILRQRLGIRLTDFDTNPWLLGTPGGTVDLKTGVLQRPDPKDFISKMTAVTPADRADCPRWKKFITEITQGDAGAALFLQQWAGYCLTGDTREQVFLFLYGPGGNGKSVLMDTLGRLAGGYYVKPVADLYFAKQGSRHMQEVAMLAGARLVTVSEVPPNASWDEGKLKDHTGGGSITANFMRQNSFSFTPQFKLTALGNHQPTFPGGMNEAIKRRFRLMLLDFQPKVPQKELMEELWKEAPEILRWCIEGLTDPAHGWHKLGLMVPQTMQDATDKYVHDQDVFGLWLEERVEKVPGAKSPSGELFQDWVDFRNANGGGDMFGNTNAFALEMSGKGYTKSRANSGKVYEGIKLKSKAKSVF